MTTTVNINLAIDPSTMSADAAADYAATVMAKLTAPVSPTTAVGSAAHIIGIDKQLGRLTDHKPVFAPRVKRLHAELVKLGYTPTLPNSKKDPLPSYISYIDPVSGENLGNLNSEKFYVMRTALRDKLAKLDHFGSDSRYANCHVVSDAAVDAMLKVAAEQKA